MEYEDLERFRRTLLSRRTALIQRWRQVLSEENELPEERDPDWEDSAAARTAALMLETVSERGRRALARIQSSLARIERGTYGKCVVCHATIDEERLCAVPDADRCGGCAPLVN